MAASAKPNPWTTRLISLLFVVIVLALVAVGIWRWQVNGWGSLVWLAGFIVTGLIRAPHARRNRENAISDDRKHLGERVLLGGMFATMMVLPLLHLATGVFGFANYALPTWAVVIGAVLQLPFVWLFWRSHADLGHNWSVSLEIHEEQSLVTKGVYARTRHPMYSAIWLAAIAQPLLIHNWIAGFLVIPAFAAMYVIRVPQEEAMMRARFGEAYDRYAARTGRIWPRLGGGQDAAA